MMSNQPLPEAKPDRGKRQLRRTLLIAFVLLSLTPILILTIVSLVDQLQSERAAALERLTLMADVGSNEVLIWASQTQGDLSLLINDAQFGAAARRLLDDPESTLARGDFAARARSVASTSNVFDAFILVDLEGNVLAATQPEMIAKESNLAAEPWFVSTDVNAEMDIWGRTPVFITGPQADIIDTQESFYFSTLVFISRDEPPVGVIVGRTSMEPLTARLQTALSSTILGESSEYYMVRGGQKYIIPPQNLTGDELATGEIVNQLLNGQSGSGTWRDYRGENVLGVYHYLAPLDIGLVLKIDAAQIAQANQSFIISHVVGLVAVGLIAVLASILITRQITNPLQALSRVAIRIAGGDLEQEIPESDTQEISDLASSLDDMTTRLKTLIDTQEEIIDTRTRQLAITTQIGRVIAAETDFSRLLQTTVDMIRDQLGHYHAQIFMLDDLRQYAVLRTSTGRAGRELLSRGHKLPVGSQSVVGQAAARGEPMLASDTRFADFWMPNPLLPETRAELAMPVRLGDEVIGVLDVQDLQPDTFDEATVNALQTVADQLAVAVRNSQLFEEKESLLSASLQLTQTLTSDGWDSYAEQRDREQQGIGFQYNLSDVQPLDTNGGSDGGGNGSSVRMPIALRGAVIGDLLADLPEGQRLSEDQQQFMSEVLDRVALALENARLFEETQRSLAESNRLYIASQGIASSDSIQDLVDELLRLCALDTIDRVTILQLDDPSLPPGGRWVEVIGRWLRSDDDPLADLPLRVKTGQPPLVAIEEVPSDGHVLNNVLNNPDLSPEAKENASQMGARAMATFPLVVSRRTIGWLSLHSTRIDNAFSENDIRYYQTIADQAATAMESLRLFQQTQIRARRLQATNDVSRAASSILNPDILLPMIVDRISEAFEYYHTQIFLIDEVGEWAVLKASTGEVGQELLRRAHRLPVGSQSVIGQVTSRGEPVIARDTDTDAVHRRNELLPKTRAEMAIPLKTGDRVIGALDVQSELVNAFDEEATVILQSLADEISVTLENAQLFQEIQDRVAELTTVNLVSQAVSRAQTLEDLYEIVTVQMMRTFGAKHGYLGIVRGAMFEIPIFLEGGERQESPPPQRLGVGLTSHVLENRQVLLINENLREEAERLGAKVIGVLPRSILAVPLLLGDEAIGVISIQDADKEHAHTDAHVRQLTTLAAYIAVKIRNAELLEEAQSRAGELGFLFNITRAAVATADLDDALTNVVNILQTDIEGAETSMVYLLDEIGDFLEPHAAVGYGRDIAARMDLIPANTGLPGLVTTQQRSVFINDARGEYNVPEEERTQSAMMVPLQTGRRFIGVLTVESSHPNAFVEDQLRLLETASGALTAVVQNAQLLEEITAANARLQELDQLKSQFLASMSHELRTPLNSIIGFSRVMLKGIDGPLNDLQTQDLNTIYTSGQHLLNLINDILDLSKIEAKMMEIQPEYTDLLEILDGVITTGQGLIQDKPINLFREIEDDLPEVYGDPVRLRQVLLNLVSNAAKFTHEGAVTVRAYTLPYDPETHAPPRVQVDVQDSGIGIPPDKVDVVFEAFRQVDGSTTRQYGGTGLGLPISRNFIELHGGKMWVESEVGKGSTFSFTVPLHPPDENVDYIDIEAGEGLAADSAGPVILTVDDEQGVIDLYARYLEKEGYTVVGLRDADQLPERVREHRPAAILLDINLPGKDGWQALEELKQDEETANVPVIICTIDEQSDQARSVKGIARYLTKPVLEDDLLQSLQEVIREVDETSQDSSVINILLVDNDEEHRTELRAYLEKQGCQVRAFAMGFEGLQAIQERQPDVLIMDVDLTDMDGYGLIVSMRTHESTRKVPVYILTARELSEEELERLQNPNVRYLNKMDYSPEELYAGLKELIADAS